MIAPACLPPPTAQTAGIDVRIGIDVMSVGLLAIFPSTLSIAYCDADETHIMGIIAIPSAQPSWN